MQHHPLTQLGSGPHIGQGVHCHLGPYLGRRVHMGLGMHPARLIGLLGGHGEDLGIGQVRIVHPDNGQPLGTFCSRLTNTTPALQAGKALA